MWVGETSDEEYQRVIAAGGRRAEIYRRLREIRDAYLGQIRTGYPNIPRRVSGYNLDQLLPEKEFHVARALVGSESTLVTVLHAEIDLVDIPRSRSLVVLGYPDIAEAADLVPLVVKHGPLAVEGLDDTLISLEREEHLAGDALGKLPEGSGWLMIQFGGDSKEDVEAKAHALIEEVQSDGDHPQPHVAYLEDPAVEDNLWNVREAGLGATAYPPGKHETHEGWEDAAVGPERLGGYLREFRDLLRRYDYEPASLYGHFGPAAQAGRRHRYPPRAAALRQGALHPLACAPRPAPDRAAGHPVARHLHQQLPSRRGPGRRRHAGKRGVHGGGASPAPVLRADLDIDRAARCGRPGAEAHRRRAAARPAGRPARGRARAQLRGGVPLRRGRTPRVR
jgi:hypothetical protein